MKPEWQDFKDMGISVKPYKNLTYNKGKYVVYLYKLHKKSNVSVATGGFIKKVKGLKVVFINNDVVEISATKEEIDSLIKHEILHFVLKHKNNKCSVETYLKRHKEMYKLMTKKELINHLIIHQRFGMQ